MPVEEILKQLMKAYRYYGDKLDEVCGAIIGNLDLLKVENLLPRADDYQEDKVSDMLSLHNKVFLDIDRIIELVYG